MNKTAHHIIRLAHQKPHLAKELRPVLFKIASGEEAKIEEAVEDLVDSSDPEKEVAGTSQRIVNNIIIWASGLATVIFSGAVFKYAGNKILEYLYEKGVWYPKALGSLAQALKDMSLEESLKNESLEKSIEEAGKFSWERLRELDPEGKRTWMRPLVSVLVILAIIVTSAAVTIKVAKFIKEKEQAEGEVSSKGKMKLDLLTNVLKSLKGGWEKHLSNFKKMMNRDGSLNKAAAEAHLSQSLASALR